MDIVNLLKNCDLPNERILLTGASGWLGRQTINLLKEILQDDFENKVILSGSKNGTILFKGTSHPIHNLYEIETNRKFDLVIHLAFITQDRMNGIGKQEYIRINNQITDTVLDLSQTCEAKRIFLASSGVVDPKINESLNSESKRIYAELKRDSENRFQHLSRNLGCSLEIGRIWTISGEFIQDPDKYAIGNFIIQAKKFGNIHLSTSSEVHRAYIDASELMGIYLNNLFSGYQGILDSGGFEIPIAELAQQVLNEISPNGSISSTGTTESSLSDTYLPNIKPFNQLASDSGVRLSSIAEQIRTTAKAEVFQL